MEPFQTSSNQFSRFGAFLYFGKSENKEAPPSLRTFLLGLFRWERRRRAGSQRIAVASQIVALYEKQ